MSRVTACAWASGREIGTPRHAEMPVVAPLEHQRYEASYPRTCKSILLGASRAARPH